MAEVMVKLLSLKYNGVDLKEAYLEGIYCKGDKGDRKREINREIMRKSIKRVKKQIEKTRDNIPILKRGKIDLLFRVLKSLSTADFLSAVVF